MAAIEAGEELAKSECRDWERSASSLLPVSVCSSILSSPPLPSPESPLLSSPHSFFLTKCSAAVQFSSVESGATATYTRRTGEGEGEGRRSDGRRVQHEITAPLPRTPHKETEVAVSIDAAMAVPRHV